MLLIYHPEPDAEGRLAYAWGLVLVHAAQLQGGHRLTQDLEVFEAYAGPRLAYGVALPGIPWVPSTGLIEADWPTQLAITEAQMGNPSLFEVLGPAPLAYKQDAPAALYWLATRLEEYLPAAPRDAHGRYLAAASWQQRHGLALQATGHRLALALMAWLEGHYPGLACKPLPFRERMTVDIDNAYAFAHKGAARWWGGLGREVAQGRAAQARLRLAHALGRAADPYDHHQALLATGQAQAEAGLPPTAFWLMESRGRYNRAVPHRHPSLARLVLAYQQAGFEIGLHPSYTEPYLPAVVRERTRLEAITGYPIEVERSHYLRHGPDRLGDLANLGFLADHTLGYATQAGIRTGMAAAYPYRDPRPGADHPEIWVHPPLWMDTPYLANPAQGQADLEALRQELRTYGGMLEVIRHNDYGV